MDRCAAARGATRRSATSSTTSFHAPRKKGTCAATRVLLAACHILLVAVCAGLTGCTSIYHRTWDKLPPEPAAELTMRVEEAQAVEHLVRQAAAKLRADLEQGASGETIQVDFDRLEMQSLELQRRVLAARDASTHAGNHADLGAEIVRLEQRSKSWLDFVQANRHAEVATQVERLEGMLVEVDGESAGAAR